MSRNGFTGGSCDNSQALLVNSLSSNVSTTYDEVIKLVSDCIHIKAAKQILETVDALNSIPVQSEFSRNGITATVVIIPMHGSGKTCVRICMAQSLIYKVVCQEYDTRTSFSGFSLGTK